jgi:hypothetical protein
MQGQPCPFLSAGRYVVAHAVGVGTGLGLLLLGSPANTTTAVLAGALDHTAKFVVKWALGSGIGAPAFLLWQGGAIIIPLNWRIPLDSASAVTGEVAGGCWSKGPLG